MNVIVEENRLPGTTDWRLNKPALGREIEGYAGATSVNRGESISLHVSSEEPGFELEVLRMGWYQGLGARRICGPWLFQGGPQLMPVMDEKAGLVDCDWRPTFILRTGKNWVSGIYLVRLTTAKSRHQSYVIFALRDDSADGGLLFQQSVTTYQAYNTWGGKSLYKWGSSAGKRARQVSFNRPYAANRDNPAAAVGMGAGEFLSNFQPHGPDYRVSNAGWEYNMVRWLEREGYPVSYCTNLDTHNSPNRLLRHRAHLSVGHDEYWSCAMRDHLEAARDAGVHLGFFTANAGYWQIRLDTSPNSGMADRVMICHKGSASDPARRGTLDARLTTTRWREPPLNRPEESLIGIMYTADPVDADIEVTAPEHWLFAGTGLRHGDRLTGLLGYEVDRAHGGGPADLTILAESPWTKLNAPQEQGVAHMSLYAAASGALIFAAGSIQWSWGLDDFNAPTLRLPRTNPAAQQITRNLLNRFLR